MDIGRLFMLIRLLGIIIGFILLYFTLKYAFILLYPFIIALTFAFILNPFVSFLESKWKIPRIVATFIVMITIFIAFISAFSLLVIELIQGTFFLAEKVPKYFQSFMYVIHQILQDQILPFYNQIISFFRTLHPSQQSIISQNIEHILSQIGSSGAYFFKKTFLTIRTFLSFLPQSVTVFVFIILATFLLTKDLPLIRTYLRKKVPLTARKSSVTVLQQSRKLLLSYLKAQLIIISFTAVTILIGLLIIGIDHAVTIALLTAIIDLLPFIGTGTVFIPWIIYLFFTGNYTLTIQLTALYMVVVITRQLIEPKILSDHLGVRPLIALIVMFAGYQIWGFIGIIIAPFLIVLYNALQRAGVTRQVINFITG